LYIVRSEVVKSQDIWIGGAWCFGKDPYVYSSGTEFRPQSEHSLLASVISTTY